MVTGGESDLKGFKAGPGIDVVPSDPRHDHLYMPGREHGGESLFAYAAQVTNGMHFPLPPFHVDVF